MNALEKQTNDSLLKYLRPSAPLHLFLERDHLKQP